MANREEKSWVVDIGNKLKEAHNPVEQEVWKKWSIYRVPGWIKDLNCKAYKRQIVSFGPYHHGDPDLLPIEEHKHRALLHFLKCADKPFDDFLDGIKEIVQQLQGSYQNLGDKWRDRDRFLQLMIVDGCFLLEVIRVATGRGDTGRGDIGRNNDYDANDPIFSRHGMFYTVPYIKRDMLIIENQLPLLVLKKLVAIESGKSPNDDQINKMVLKFCAPSSPPPTPGIGLGLHPLDLFRRSLLQGPQSSPQAMSFTSAASSPQSSPQALSFTQRIRAFHQRLQALSFIRRIRAFLQRLWSIRVSNPFRSLIVQMEYQSFMVQMVPMSSGIVRSAVELYEAGIRFKKSNSNSLYDIRFRHGVLVLPMLVVDDATDYMFLNLMAFERLHVGADNCITSYVFFMVNIIDSAKDVSLLQSEGIIENAVGSNEAIAKIFNNLSKDLVLGSEGKFDDVRRKVNDYCRKKWNKWRANLIHTYFRSPWAFLSLAAAIFLLVLTVVQTVYTVYSAYHSH